MRGLFGNESKNSTKLSLYDIYSTYILGFPWMSYYIDMVLYHFMYQKFQRYFREKIEIEK